MVDYQLKVDNCGMVRYLMKQKGANVAGRVAALDAARMMGNRSARVSDEFEDYPVTVDGVYFFDAMYRIMEEDGHE